MLMQGQMQQEAGEELDCVIDYPITATALWNYPPPACRASGAFPRYTFLLDRTQGLRATL